MGGRGSSSTVTTGGQQMNPNQFQVVADPPQQAVTQQQAQQANNSTFPDTDTSPFHQLKGGAQYFQSQNLTPDQVWATLEYLRTDTGRTDSWSTKGTPAQNATQSPLYSMAQNMNALAMYNHDHGLPMESGMSANQQYVARHIEGAMHNLGQNLTLTRYDHSGVVTRLLQQAGISTSYSKMSAAQLSRALTGVTYTEGRTLSTSYNGFAKITDPSTRMTFMHRTVRLEYKAGAATQAMMPGRGPGGDFGEILLSKNTRYRITGVRWDNSVRVRHKGTAGLSNDPQLVLEVETY